jgi:hypothetical protein
MKVLEKCSQLGMVDDVIDALCFILTWMKTQGLNTVLQLFRNSSDQNFRLLCISILIAPWHLTGSGLCKNVVFQLPCSIITWGDIMTTECIR